MGKSSGKSGPTTSNVTQTNLPAYARPYYERLMARGEAESNQPYISYPGQRLAGFDADTSLAFQGVRDMYNNGQPGQIDAATDRAQQAADYQNPYQAHTFDGGTWNSAAAQQYMDPYIQNVLDVQRNRMTRNYDEQQNARDAQAVKQGAFGGSRSAVANAVAQRGLNEQMAFMDAQGLSNAYNSAAGLWDKDRMARIGAEKLSNETLAQLAQLGLSNEGLGLQSAQTLAGLGQLGQTMGFERNKMLQQVGGTEQAQQQQSYDIGYNDFMNQRDYPKQQLSFLSSLLHGVPVSASSTVTQYQPQPSTLQSLLGLGLGGAGLFKMFGG